jgi:DNA-binding IclR family transcriptional regulator
MLRPAIELWKWGGQSMGRCTRRGYAIDDQEIEVGVRCIGAPIFDEKRNAIAAVSVSGPASRITAPSVVSSSLRRLR